MASAVLLLAACSAVKLSYNNIDLFVRWKVAGYFDLDAEQDAAFQDRLRRYHAWHRAVELPVYAALCRAAAAHVEDGLTRAELDWALAATRERYRALTRQAVDDAAPLLATLRPEQIDHLAGKFAESNEKFADGLVRPAPEKRQRERIAKVTEAWEDWLGSVTPAQKEAIVAAVQRAPSLSGHQLAERRITQRDTLAVLRSERDPTRLATRLKDIWARLDLRRKPAYQRDYQVSEAEFTRLALEIDSLASPAQRQHAADRLRSFGADFETLAQHPEGAIASAAAR